MKNTVAALEFGTGKIVALIAETGANQRCDIIGAGTAVYDGYLSGQWNSPDQLNQAIGNAIREAENQARTRIREINIGVPGDFSQVRTVEVKVDLQGADPKVAPRDIDALFTRAADALGDVRGNIIHRAPAWFIVDDGKKIMEPTGVHGFELRGMVSFIVADPFFLEDVTSRINSLGIAVSGCFSAPAGQANLFVPMEEREKTAVIVDVGYLCTEVMTMEGDALTSLNVIPMGGGNISADVAYGLEIPLSAAEQIKRQYVFGLAGNQPNFDVTDANGDNRTFKQAEVEKYLEPRVEEILEAVQDALDDSGVKLNNWSKVYLTGGGIAINRGGRDFAAAKLSRPVSELPRKAIKLSSPAYSSALGLLDLIIDTVCEVKNNSGIGGFLRNLFGA